MKYSKIIIPTTLAVLLTTPLLADNRSDILQLQEEIKELKAQTEVLIDETSDLQAGFSYTTADDDKSYSGLGGAASKVYYSESPLSIGGYGEMYYSRTEKENGDKSSKIDVYRFVPYIGYKFTDNIILNTEIEFEHGGVTPDKGGEVIVEFMYIDFLINKNFNLRIGNMLIPMGLINERHEPTLFTTVQRPSTSKYLIPSTWHESGLMAYGHITDTLSYKFAAVSALKPLDNGKKWLRSGRGGSFKNEDPKLAVVARVDYTGLRGLMSGVSLYSDNDLLMLDAHVDYKSNGARVYGVYTQTSRSNTKPLQVKSANGGYLNVSFDILTFTSYKEQLPLFVQYESINPEATLGNGTQGHKTDTLTLGLNYYPHPQVLLKVDYAMATQEQKKESVTSLSMGFIF